MARAYVALGDGRGESEGADDSESGAANEKNIQDENKAA